MEAAWTDERLGEALQKHFGLSAFREGQAEAVKTVLNGRDLVLVMPTGSGKSLCYQLSALLMPGVTVVISPLIALMKDQVDALDRKGIAATFLNSSVDADEMGYRLDGLRQGRYKLVYVAPERFRNRRFVDALAAIHVSLLTIDEAHCISQWGHDFRPDYLNLKQVLLQLGPVRVMAVTATATPEVRDDIILQLGLKEPPRDGPVVSVTGFARPNLYLAVARCATHRHKFSRLVQIVEAYRCGIVYCATRKMVERVAAMLQGDGFDSILYHGAMADGERTAAQERFMSASSPVVVATNAFGMGVDRGDLRFVVHWDMPGSLEAYYQEIGRAGRDGASAWCELLFNYADKSTQQFFIDGANPSFADILAVWVAVRQACEAQPVTSTVEEWAKLAKVKNDMEVRTILGLIERARLIEREILPGNRSYTTRLQAGADPAELRRLAAGLEEKRARDQRKLDRLIQFVDYPGCRHAFLLNYFGEPMRQSSCNACDRCRHKPLEKRVSPNEEQWIAVQKILSCVARMKGRFGAMRVAQVLHGDREEVVVRHGLDALSTFGLLSDWAIPQIRAVIDALQAEGCLEVTPDEYRMVALSPKGRQVMLRTYEGFLIAWPHDKGGVRSEASGVGARKKTRAPQAPAPEKRQETVGFCAAAGAEPDHAVAVRLQKWVSKTAAAHAVKPYMILGRQTVEAIAAARPKTFSELEAIKGMGPVKVQRYGRMILDLIVGTEVVSD